MYILEPYTCSSASFAVSRKCTCLGIQHRESRCMFLRISAARFQGVEKTLNPVSLRMFHSSNEVPTTVRDNVCWRIFWKLPVIYHVLEELPNILATVFNNLTACEVIHLLHKLPVDSMERPASVSLTNALFVVVLMTKMCKEALDERLAYLSGGLSRHECG